VNQLPKSVVREIRTPRSVGTGGGRPPPVTRCGDGNILTYSDMPAGSRAGQKPLNYRTPIVAAR